MFRRPPQHQLQPRRRSLRSPAPGRPVLAAIALVCAGFVLVGAACSGDDGADPGPSSSTSFSLPPPDDAEQISTVTVPEGFVLMDASGVPLTPFESKARPNLPPLPVRGGGASLSGLVVGPDGPVAGASVLIERVVGDRTGSLALSSGGDGRYSVSGIHGGKYRIRAWQTPSLASRTSSLVYLNDFDGSADVEVPVERFTGKTMQIGLDISALNVGDTAHVRVLLTDQVVNDSGIVVGQGVAGARVKLASSASASMRVDDDTATTDSQGMARWEVTCTKEGTTGFTASGYGVTASFTTPSCGPRPTTTTTSSDPDVPDFEVGEEFYVPRKAALPAGSYKTFLDGCKTTYQVYVDGEWQKDRRTATGSDLVISVPARDFKPADGTRGCTYRRQA